MLKSIARRLSHLHVRVAVLVLCFWTLQGVGWMGTMLYIQFFAPKVGNSVLYVTQVSNWALVLSCGVAATAAWGLIANRGGHDDVLARVERLQEEMYEHLLRTERD